MSIYADAFVAQRAVIIMKTFVFSFPMSKKQLQWRRQSGLLIACHTWYRDLLAGKTEVNT
jgi:hypothetical protein